MKKKYLKPKTFTQRLKLESFMLTASPGVSDDEFDQVKELGQKKKTLKKIKSLFWVL